jgi:hypothetical protein
MSELSFSLLLDWIGNTLISDSRAQQFSWKFIATLPSENCIFFNKNDSWLSCLVLLQVHDHTGALFCASTSPWWCPSTAVAMTCYGLQSACKHAALLCWVCLVLLHVDDLDECAALLYCLVLWQACGQGKAGRELYFESMLGTFVYAMLTYMTNLNAFC